MSNAQDVLLYIPDSKVHKANMGPTWVLLAPDGPNVSPMNLAIRDGIKVIDILEELLVSHYNMMQWWSPSPESLSTIHNSP